MVADDEDAPLGDRIRDLHDGGLLGNRGRGLPVVEDADEDATRLGLLYGADGFTRRGGDLDRISRLIAAGLESAEQTRKHR